MVKSISVIGLGKLGSPLAACLAARGLRVIAADVDPRKVDATNRGEPAVHEPGLAELIRESEGRLRATADVEAAVSDSEVTFIVVGTPSEASGGFSLRYVLPACEKIGNAMRKKQEFHLVVLTSTVMPGDTEREVKPALEKASGKRCGIGFGLCFSPEFIALGSVIRDFYNPDFVLIGESDVRSGDMLAEIYKHVCKNSPQMARMNFVNAEVTKLAVNTFVTTKISFANMIARLCEKLPGAEANVVTAALGKDTRIGSKYLNGGISYGGPCFPRDNRAFSALAASLGSFSDLAEATDRFNRAQIKWLAELVKKHLAAESAAALVGILGLTYKPNTDVVEESVGVLLTQELSASGIPVSVYDPSTDKTPAAIDCKGVRYATSAAECIAAADVVVLATPWQAFKEIPALAWARVSEPRVVIDCWQALGSLDGAEGVRYVCLGSGSEAEYPVETASSAV
jgi:UDPglucose 6-dehydrogenase